MSKVRKSTSSRLAKLTSVTSEEIKNGQWTERELQVLRKIAKWQAAEDEPDTNR